MNDDFAPRLDILPNPQQRLWKELAGVPSEFVLFGGTAVALHLGHRQSESNEDFLEALEKAPPAIIDARSWAYWNSVMARYPAPPLPRRTLVDFDKRQEAMASKAGLKLRKSGGYITPPSAPHAPR